MRPGSEQNPEGCDATKTDRGTEAGYKIKIVCFRDLINEMILQHTSSAGWQRQGLYLTFATTFAPALFADCMMRNTSP